jgi:hypothetical protein
VPRTWVPMADVFMYVDETGNLDFDGAAKGSAASIYFGFGSAVFREDHGHHLWDGLTLRARLEGEGTQLARGFHAKNDRHAVRNEVFAAIHRQKPRIDTTFLCKANAYEAVRARGQMELYKLAWRLHFSEIAKQVSTREDTLYVIAGTFGTNKRSELAREALREVCNAQDRNIILCVWESSSSWGLQVADYALWAVQRRLEERECSWFEPVVQPQLKSYFFPWGRAR